MRTMRRRRRRRGLYLALLVMGLLLLALPGLTASAVARVWP